MFDIGFAELLLLAVISLLVLGPERLPGAVRTGGIWLARIRRSLNSIKTELEQELNTAELKQDLHNQSIMKQLGEDGKQITKDLDKVRASLKDLEFSLEDKQAGEHRAGAATQKDSGPT